MSIQQSSRKILSILFIAWLWVTPELMHAAVQAQGSQQPAPQAQPETQQPAQQPAGQQGQAAPQSQPQVNGTRVDPSQAPLQPVTTYYPDSPTSQNQQPAQTTTRPAPEARKPVTEPVGAGAAESVPTAGGAAAKPAGVAIAPAKQHQMRSLFIKIGAFAAAGVAVGTIYALSRGTPSTPPGTNLPGVTQK